MFYMTLYICVLASLKTALASDAYATTETLPISTDGSLIIGGYVYLGSPTEVEGSTSASAQSSYPVLVPTSTGYSWNPSGSTNLDLTRSGASGPLSSLGTASSYGRPSDTQPIEATVTEADGTVVYGPASYATLVSTAAAATVTTVIHTEPAVVVTTVTTSLICTCDDEPRQKRMEPLTGFVVQVSSNPDVTTQIAADKESFQESGSKSSGQARRAKPLISAPATALTVRDMTRS